MPAAIFWPANSRGHFPTSLVQSFCWKLAWESVLFLCLLFPSRSQVPFIFSLRLTFHDCRMKPARFPSNPSRESAFFVWWKCHALLRAIGVHSLEPCSGKDCGRRWQYWLDVYFKKASKKSNNFTLPMGYLFFSIITFQSTSYLEQGQWGDILVTAAWKILS